MCFPFKGKGVYDGGSSAVLYNIIIITVIDGVYKVHLTILGDDTHEYLHDFWEPYRRVMTASKIIIILSFVNNTRTVLLYYKKIKNRT